MRAQGVIGLYSLRDQVGALWLDAWIDMLAVIAIRPTVEGALLD